MQILDTLRKNRDSKNKEHTTPPPEGHALAEILKDPNKLHLFGEMLKGNGHDDLAEKIAEEQLEESDIGLLEKQRKIFSEKMATVEKVEKLLTRESIEELARRNPDFGKVVNILTPDGAVNVIQSQLLEISITDEPRFKYISQAIEASEGYKNGDYKERSTQIEKLCNDKKITLQEYSDAMAIEDDDKKEEALEQLSSRTYGGFKKIIHFFSKGKYGQNTTLQALKESAVLSERSMGELDGHYSNIANALALSIKGNDSMRKALARELVGEKATIEKKSKLGDMKKEAANAFSEEKTDEDWEEYKTATDYANHPDQQEVIKEKFIANQKKQYKEKSKNTGFWASVFASVFEKKISNMKNKLK